MIVNFASAVAAGDSRVTIAPQGAPAQQLRMWLYTNGTQRATSTGQSSGQLPFRSEYIGIGQFEARLFSGGRPTPASRAAFEIKEQ